MLSKPNRHAHIHHLKVRDVQREKRLLAAHWGQRKHLLCICVCACVGVCDKEREREEIVTMQIKQLKFKKSHTHTCPNEKKAIKIQQASQLIAYQMYTSSDTTVNNFCEKF